MSWYYKFRFLSHFQNLGTETFFFLKAKFLGNVTTELSYKKDKFLIQNFDF